jgi:hypothetical protein
MKSKPCEKQYNCCADKCGSSVHLLLGKIISNKEKHEHPNDETRIVKLKFRNNLRKLVAEDPLESVNSYSKIINPQLVILNIIDISKYPVKVSAMYMYLDLSESLVAPGNTAAPSLLFGAVRAAVSLLYSRGRKTKGRKSKSPFKNCSL